MSTRAGMSLIELVVALTVLSIGVLGLAGAAAVAHRSFATADAIERGAHAAAAVLDSLMHEQAPRAGERSTHGARVHWTVTADGDVSRITATVEVADGGMLHAMTYHAVHSAHLAY